MRRIGVLGGMGPAATADFVHRLVAEVGASRDQDHPECIVYNACQIPDRTAHLLGRGEDPTAALQRAARVVESAGAELIAIPCNSAHAYLGAIQDAVAVPVLDMIALAAGAVARRGAETTVGLLVASGTARIGLYQRELEQRDIGFVLPESALQDRVMEAVRAIKGGQLGTDERLVEALTWLQSAGATVALLGCTELPLGVDAAASPLPLIDATAVLVEQTLDRAGVRSTRSMYDSTAPAGCA